MLIIRYDRVVSHLPLFEENDINVEAPLKFLGIYVLKISEIQASKS